MHGVEKRELMECQNVVGPVPVAGQSKMYVCGCLIVGIAGSNSTEGMDYHLFCLLCCIS